MEKNPVLKNRIKEIIKELRKPGNNHYLTDINGIRANLKSKLSMKRMIYFIAVHPVIWEQSNRTRSRDKTTALDYLVTFKEYERARAKDELEYQTNLVKLKGKQHTPVEDGEIWGYMQRDIAAYIVNLYEVRSNVLEHNWQPLD